MWQEMPVNVQRDGNIRMPQAFTDHLNRHTFRKPLASHRVPQILGPQTVGQPRLLNQPLEIIIDVSASEPCAVVRGKDPTVLNLRDGAEHRRARG